MEIRNDNGWTCLLAAASSGKPKAVKMLLLLGADIHAKNNYGRNAFDLASEGGHAQVCTILGERGLGSEMVEGAEGGKGKLLASCLPSIELKEGQEVKHTRRRGRRKTFNGYSTGTTSDAASGRERPRPRAVHSSMSATAPVANVGHRRAAAQRRNVNDRSQTLPPLSDESYGQGGQSSTLDGNYDGGGGGGGGSSGYPSAAHAPAPAPAPAADSYDRSYKANAQHLGAGMETNFERADERTLAGASADTGTGISFQSPSGISVASSSDYSPSPHVLAATFADLNHTKRSQITQRRAPESRRVVDIRLRREIENSVEYVRKTREVERLHKDEEERHVTKAIDKEKYLGSYTKDRTRRRSF